VKDGYIAGRKYEKLLPSSVTRLTMRTREELEEEYVRWFRNLKTGESSVESLMVGAMGQIREICLDIRDLLSHEKENSVPQHILDEASKKWHEENQKQENTHL
jgi:hypothetical protein